MADRDPSPTDDDSSDGDSTDGDSSAPSAGSGDGQAVWRAGTERVAADAGPERDGEPLRPADQPVRDVEDRPGHAGAD